MVTFKRILLLIYAGPRYMKFQGNNTQFFSKNFSKYPLGLAQQFLTTLIIEENEEISDKIQK